MYQNTWKTATCLKDNEHRRENNRLTLNMEVLTRLLQDGLLYCSNDYLMDVSYTTFLGTGFGFEDWKDAVGITNGQKA